MSILLRQLTRPLRPFRVHNLAIPSHQLFSSSSSSYTPTLPSGVYPSPPRLPPKEQLQFEQLQKRAGILPPDPPSASSLKTQSQQQQQQEVISASSATTPESETEASSSVGVGVFRGAPPEFEGDVNSKTGEVGGPKNEPLRWGGQSDWSYNGRVTDF